MVELHHEDSASAYRDALSRVETLEGTEQWVVVIWRVKDGKIHQDRVRCKFPAEDVRQAIGMLAGDLIAGEPPGPLPMARAEFLRAIKPEELTGDASPGEDGDKAGDKAGTTGGQDGDRDDA